ncbi:MAG TPA: phosphoribosylaminoimidazolesuccinocarboxamide synthase [Polyangiaceae bacterium]|nr:phosphoribosylaminoimidazolesuccinocarboxamide synthase [Polyangiaceae bacterium]
MNAQSPESTFSRQPTELITQGKTKWIYQDPENSDQVILVSKDDITAGDGKKHDIISGKARLSNQTTSNVFEFLANCKLPVGFIRRLDEVSFVAPKCRMLPYEVVVRREAHGSYLKRNPQLRKGQLFSKLVVEFYLKTKGRRWKQFELTCDDPLIGYTDGSDQIQLLNPAVVSSEPFLTLPTGEVFEQPEEWKLFAEMRTIARRAFLHLEKAWQLEGRKLVDFKVEFGLSTKQQLLLADVIDNDSWRVVENDRYIDKQLYRDGGSLNEVEASYRRVAAITSHFRVPSQRIILWRGSDSDNVEVFTRALGSLDSLVTVVTCSAHKEPVMATLKLQQLAQETPDSVVIAYIGRSNGAGPTLSAMSTLPVITVPASAKEFPEDVWSSLRAPSKVPVMTVLEPSNAVLAALQILSARNPIIYARLREELESRAVNTIQI